MVVKNTAKQVCHCHIYPTLVNGKVVIAAGTGIHTMLIFEE
jgi:hypothetical protein